MNRRRGILIISIDEAEAYRRWFEFLLAHEPDLLVREELNIAMDLYVDMLGVPVPDELVALWRTKP